MGKDIPVPVSPLDDMDMAPATSTRARQVRWNETDSKVDLVRPVVPPRPLEVAAEPKDIVFDLARSAVIVVDMQNDFMRDDGWFGTRGVDLSAIWKPVAPLQNFLPHMRRADVPIVWVNWGVRADGLDLPPNVLYKGGRAGEGGGVGDLHPTKGYRVLELGTWGAAIIDELPADQNDIHVAKVRLSGFWETDLDGVLRHMGITTLLFTGVNLDRCVMATLQDASFLGYDCILVDDCSATVHPEFATQTCHLMIKQLLGFITTSNDVLGSLSAQEETT
jgi:nicotinamidase-related amidase